MNFNRDDAFTEEPTLVDIPVVTAHPPLALNAPELERWGWATLADWVRWNHEVDGA